MTMTSASITTALSAKMTTKGTATTTSMTAPKTTKLYKAEIKSD